MSTDVSSEFEKFHAAICLTQTQVDRIESARSALEAYLLNNVDHLKPGDITLQGSYANGTAVKPVAGGEYDVDIIVRSADSGDTADDALEDLAEVLLQHGTYKGKIKEKTPCVRVEYADDYIGGFHVDLVPVRESTDSDAPLDAPRRGKGWHPTAPDEYTTWCANQSNEFRRTVRMMKRWRDEQQDVRYGVKSIVLQVLVAQHLAIADNDADRLHDTFEALHTYLSGFTTPPVVSNPVLLDENLTARWDQESFDDFKKALAAAVEVSQAAVSAEDRTEAGESWRSLLGDSFPEHVAKGLSAMTVADISHAEPVNTRGWYELIDRRFELAVTCAEGRNTKKMSNYPSDSRLLFAGKKLRFKATLEGPAHAEVWWRITNTGKHARDVDGLRGDFQRAQDLRKKRSADPLTHWESTAYTGSHVVEAFAVLGDRVVAKSQPFIVRIHRAGVSWAW